MSQSEDDGIEAYSSVKSTMRVSSTLSASIGVCFDQGRIAAMNGFKITANPYLNESEPAGYQAWLDGFNDQMRREPQNRA